MKKSFFVRHVVRGLFAGALALNVCGCFLHFLEEHAVSYNLGAVIEGREVIYGVPFVVRHRSADGSSSGLTLLTPKPGHEWAFLGERTGAARDVR